MMPRIAVLCLCLAAAVWADSGPLAWPLIFLGVFACSMAHTRKIRWLTLIILLTCMARFVVAEWQGRSVDIDPALHGHVVVLPVTLDSLPKRIETTEVWTVRVALPDLPSRMTLTVNEGLGSVRLGSCLRIRARLHVISDHGNPHQFDHRLWRRLEGIGARAVLVSPSYIRSCAAHAPSLRWRIIGRFSDALESGGISQRAAALILALTTGERVGVDRDTRRLLRQSGVAHLLAISGLHIGLVSGVVFALVRLIVLPGGIGGQDAAWFAAVFTALFFVWLSGAGLPATRALTMVVAIAIATWLRWPIRLSTQLAIAVFVTLVLWPKAVVGVSFALSFSAVASLAVYFHVLSSSGSERSGLFRKAVTAQLLLSGALMPVSGLWFGESSLAAPWLNLVLVPFFSFIVIPLTLIAVLMTLLPGEVHGPVLASTAWLIDRVIDALQGVSQGPDWLQPFVGFSSVVALVLTAMLSIGLLGRAVPGRTLLLLGGVAICRWQPAVLPFGCAAVTTLDVGHGTAIHLSLGDANVLYDTGPSWRSGGSAAEQVIGPYLRGESVETLTAVIVSHSDIDHSGGVAVLRDRFLVRHWVDTDARFGARCMAGQRWHINGVMLQVVWPVAAINRSLLTDNDRSCVLRLTVGRQRVLFTGDIERHAERQILAMGETPTEFLTVPHHGSKTSSSEDFVAATGAREAWVSNALLGRWRMPAAEVAERWQQSSVALRDTGRSGAIRARFCVGKLPISSGFRDAKTTGDLW
ncbi:MAG: DNA internalization-related competence protein ComEC/Rec2 [Pseudomonadota bacterium]